jgi:CO dehydrogenase/acetyl-CoA synthase beta subunit
MPTLVEMLDDVYPQGCLGDIVSLSDADMKQLEKVAKVRKHPIYKLANQAAEAKDEDEDSDEDDTSDEPTLNDLRARAKELNVSAGGSKEDLKSRIAEAEAKDEDE